MLNYCYEVQKKIMHMLCQKRKFIFVLKFNGVDTDQSDLMYNIFKEIFKKFKCNSIFFYLGMTSHNVLYGWLTSHFNLPHTKTHL